MTKTQLKPAILERIKRDFPIQGDISEALAPYTKNGKPVSGDTIKRRIKGNSPQLCSPAVLRLISKRYDIPVEDLTEEVEMTDTTTVY